MRRSYGLDDVSFSPGFSPVPISLSLAKPRPFSPGLFANSNSGLRLELELAKRAGEKEIGTGEKPGEKETSCKP